MFKIFIDKSKYCTWAHTFCNMFLNKTGLIDAAPLKYICPDPARTLVVVPIANKWLIWGCKNLSSFPEGEETLWWHLYSGTFLGINLVYIAAKTLFCLTSSPALSFSWKQSSINHLHKNYPIFLRIHLYLKQGLITPLCSQLINPIFISAPYVCLKI